jgi:uncharacterized membrane protein YbhN (UPF0104 family)
MPAGLGVGCGYQVGYPNVTDSHLLIVLLPMSGMETTGPEPQTTAPARRGLLSGWPGIVLRLVATVLLMAYALRGITWGTFAALLANADWRWWIAGLATGIAVQIVAGVRWAALARPLGFPFSRRFFVWRFLEGSFFSLCLPSSIGGDVIKAYRVGDTTQRRLLAGCSVLADRLTGLAALGVLAVTALAGTKHALSLPATLAVGAALLALTLAVFMLGVASIDRLLAIIPAPHPAREFIARLLPYQQRPSLMAHAVGWSFIVQMGGAMAVGLMARSLGVVQPLATWFAVVPLVALAVVLPISINGVGVRENALAVLLAPHGVATESAVAVGLIWLASQIVTGLIGGGLFLIDRQAAMPDAGRR